MKKATKSYDFNVQIKKKQVNKDNIKHAAQSDAGCKCKGGAIPSNP